MPTPPAGLHLWIGGVDVLPYLSDQLTMTDSGFSAIGVMQFRAEAPVGVLSLQNEQTVQLVNGATVYYYGLLKTATPVAELCTPGWRAYDIECQDPTILAGHDVISTELSSLTDISGFTDRQLISLAFSTFGTKGIVIGSECQTLSTHIPTTAFLGMTLAAFMNALCGLTGGSWYVDYSLHLHYFVTESVLAPFAISDAPNNVTSFGYDLFSLARDTVDLHNKVLYIPGGGGTAVPTWYSDPVSIAAVAAACGDNGIRATSVTDQTITSQTVLNEAGAAFLLANAAKQLGSCTVFQPGLRAGMQVSITNANEGLSAATFAITAVTMTLVANSTPVYLIGFGSRPLDRLTSVIGSVANQAVPVLPQVDAALANAVAMNYAAGIIPPQIVNSLPSLPNAKYPLDCLVVLTTDNRLYQNVANSWVNAVHQGLPTGFSGIPSVGSLPSLPDTNYPAGMVVFYSVDGKLYRNVANAWTKAVDGADITAATITGDRLVAGTIQAAQIAAGTITGDRIAAATIGADRLVANSITAGQIAAGAIGATQIAAGGVTADKIAANSIDFTKLGNTAYDLISSGIPHGSFIDATAGGVTLGSNRDDAAGKHASIPGWTCWSGNTNGFLAIVGDASWPGGHYASLTFNGTGSASVNNVAMTSDLFPIPAQAQLTSQIVRTRNVPAGVTLNFTRTILYYDSGGNYISADSDTSAVVGPNNINGASIGNPHMVPVNARYGRVEVNLWETGSHSASTYYYLGWNGLLVQWSFGNYLYDLTVGGNLWLGGGRSTTAGAAMLNAADAGAQRSLLGLGSIATYNVVDVAAPWIGMDLNLQNPGFEQGLTGWQCNGSMWTEPNPGGVNMPGNSQLVICKQPGAYGFLQQYAPYGILIPAGSGETIRFGVYALAPWGNCSFTVWGICLDINGSEFSWPSNTFTITNGQGWYVADVGLSAQTRYFYPRFQSNSDNTYVFIAQVLVRRASV